MRTLPRLTTAERLVGLVLAALVVAMLLLRAVDLEADFPCEITASNAPFTDEGWYSTGSIRWFLQSEWYLPGDMNNGVMFPTQQWLQALNFYVFGMSLTTARLLVVLYFAGLNWVTYRILMEFGSPVAAVMACLLLSSNFVLFAYSRTAMLELPMVWFALLAYWLADPLRALSRTRTLLSGLSLSAAVLAKLSGLFLVPAFLFRLVSSPRDFATRATRERLLIFSGGALLPFTLHYLNVWFQYSADWASYGLGSSRVSSLSEWLASVRNVVWEQLKLDPWVAAALLVGVGSLYWGRWDRRRLWQLLGLAVLLAGYGVALTVTTYHPTRYVVPALVLSALLAMALAALNLEKERVWVAGAILALAAMSSLVGMLSIGRYWVSRESTFANAYRDIETTVRAQSENPVLMGNEALQVSLATGIWGVNGLYGVETLEWRVQNYSPSHFVSAGPMDEKIRERLAATHSIGPEVRFQVRRQCRNDLVLYPLRPASDGLNREAPEGPPGDG